MQIVKIVSKRRLSLSLLTIFILLTSCVTIALLGQPQVVYRFATKIYTTYKIYELKYPNSHFVESEIKPTSKVTMATDYTYYTVDDIDTVREYMEQQIPGFVHLEGSRVINEPTYINIICADERVVRYLFQVLGGGGPCIEVKVYPSDNSETLITITENWGSLGFPAWLRRF